MIAELNIFTDGGSRGNPGEAGIGVYITDQKRKKITEFGKKIGINTNNAAEYMAVIAALFWIKKNKDKLENLSGVNFFLDSSLVCAQIKGIFKIKNETLRGLFFSVKEIEKEIGVSISYSHIPREQNVQADKLVNMSLDRV